MSHCSFLFAKKHKKSYWKTDRGVYLRSSVRNMIITMKSEQALKIQEKASKEFQSGKQKNSDLQCPYNLRKVVDVMSKNVNLQQKERCVTKGVMERVDNFTQHNIWTRIIDKMKMKEVGMCELELKTCETCNCQAVSVKDTDGSLNDCWFAPGMVCESIIVFYDAEKDTEYMMLKSESESLAEK